MIRFNDTYVPTWKADRVGTKDPSPFVGTSLSVKKHAKPQSSPPRGPVIRKFLFLKLLLQKTCLVTATKVYVLLDSMEHLVLPKCHSCPQDWRVLETLALREYQLHAEFARGTIQVFSKSQWYALYYCLVSPSRLLWLHFAEFRQASMTSIYVLSALMPVVFLTIKGSVPCIVNGSSFCLFHSNTNQVLISTWVPHTR